MAMQAHEIETLIRESFPEARITITDLTGDGNHYAAEVIDEINAEDAQKAREVERLELEVQEKESIMRLRARARQTAGRLR